MYGILRPRPKPIRCRAGKRSAKAWLFSFHKTVGLAAFLVAIFRVAWAISQPRPGSLSPKGAQAFLAETVHWALYARMIMVPLAGWITHAASEGFAQIWWPFGQSLPLVPKSPTLTAVAGQIHMAWEKILIVSILLHMAGAIKHHVIDKDATLRRMLPGTPKVTAVRAGHDMLPPIVAAIAFVIVAGLAYSLTDAPKSTSANDITSTQGNWDITKGQLSITVPQFGTAVEGTFAKWSANITFDDQIENGIAGRVDGEIDITSLTLGSVTAQALGMEYFHAELFPKANFSGQIMHDTEGQRLVGEMTLKGATQPFDMPFDLTIADDTSQAIGQFTLQRLGFNIGPMDMGTVGPDVLVNVSLTAGRR